jgi:hypothetical protein
MPCPPACATCADLRATALSIVGTDGIDALTLERLAADAHQPADDIKAHYPTAPDCLYDTYEAVAKSIYEDFAAAFTAEQGWRDALRLGSTTLVRRMAARPTEARLCFIEIFHADSELLRRREANRRRLVALFVRERERRCGCSESLKMQLELLIGAAFQAMASAVAQDRVTEDETLAAELESRAFIFEPAAA